MESKCQRRNNSERTSGRKETMKSTGNKRNKNMESKNKRRNNSDRTLGQTTNMKNNRNKKNRKS